MLIPRCFLLLSALLGLWLPCAYAETESRLALLIGNASYKSSPLSNPVNDVRLMESALKEAGFTVLKAENASIREMRRLVRDFGDKLKTSGGVGLFYFAGHGVQVRGENYLVSTDSDIRNEDEVADDSVNANVILEKMQNAGNRMNLIVLDACRNNPFAVKSRSAASGLATMSAPSGSLVAYSTAPGSVASDGAGKNGLYTEHLARVIRQPGLPVEEVFKQVRAAVRKDSNNQQTPWENTALEGQFYFKSPLQVAAPQSVPAPAATVRPAGADPVALELALWESVKSATTPGELQAYLSRYPRGIFSDVAKAKMAALSSAAGERAAMEKASLERVANERAIAEAYLKAASERGAAERMQASQAAGKGVDPLALDMAFWESIKSNQRSSELQAYLTQFPNGTFVALARGRLEELKAVSSPASIPSPPGATVEKDTAKPVTAPMPLIANGALGTLVLTDTLTGAKRSMDILVKESNAEKTSYSSGDVIAKDGRVLQARIGEAVVRPVSGSLWTIPLKVGSVGDVKISRIDVSYESAGTLSWKVVAAGDGKVQIEAQVSYRIVNNSNAFGFGKWLAVYSEGRPLPDSFSAVIRPIGAGNMVSAELRLR